MQKISHTFPNNLVTAVLYWYLCLLISRFVCSAAPSPFCGGHFLHLGDQLDDDTDNMDQARDTVPKQLIGGNDGDNTLLKQPFGRSRTDDDTPLKHVVYSRLLTDCE